MSMSDDLVAKLNSVEVRNALGTLQNFSVFNEMGMTCEFSCNDLNNFVSVI